MANSTPGEVKKQLNGITLLCLAFVICNSWAGIAGSLQLALLAGGPATLIYSILVTTTAYLAIAASMAELAAVYPTAGGQYHFASILAPERWRRGVSYTCGLLALFSWLVIGVSVTSIAAQQLLALVSTSLSDFVPQSWHVFLIYQGFALFAMLYNAFVLKKNPWTHTLACLYYKRSPNKVHWSDSLRSYPHNRLIFDVFYPLTCKRKSERTSRVRLEHLLELYWMARRRVFSHRSLDILLHVQWPRRRHAYGRGVQQRGKGCTSHHAGGSWHWVHHRVCIYSGTGLCYIWYPRNHDHDSVSLSSHCHFRFAALVTHLRWIPFVVMEQGFRSRTIAIVIVSFSVVLGMTIIIATQEASSRLAWSLARDKGLLFSRFLQDLHPRLDVPLWSLLLVWLLTFVCGFLYLASKTGEEPLTSKWNIEVCTNCHLLNKLSMQLWARPLSFSSCHSPYLLFW